MYYRKLALVCCTTKIVPKRIHLNRAFHNIFAEYVFTHYSCICTNHGQQSSALPYHIRDFEGRRNQ